MNSLNEIVKECYARFGLAYYLSECIGKEMTSIYAISGFRNNSDINRSRIEEKYSEAFSLTTGQLAQKIKPYLDDAVYSKLEQIILKRNYLAHHFWYDNAVKFMNSNSIIELIDELNEMINDFERFNNKLMNLFSAKYTEIGLTDELLNESFERVMDGTDSKIEKKRKLKSIEKLIRIWTVKNRDCNFYIFETDDNELWSLCDVGLGWTSKKKVESEWILEDIFNKYLPSDIVPRPKNITAWNYSFSLKEKMIIKINKLESESFYRIGIKKVV